MNVFLLRQPRNYVAIYSRDKLSSNASPDFIESAVKIWPIVCENSIKSTFFTRIHQTGLNLRAILRCFHYIADGFFRHGFLLFPRGLGVVLLYTEVS